MTYTVSLDFVIDEDFVRSDDEVKEMVEEIFDAYNCDAENIRILEVND